MESLRILFLFLSPVGEPEKGITMEFIPTSGPSDRSLAAKCKSAMSTARIKRGKIPFLQADRPVVIYIGA